MKPVLEKNALFQSLKKCQLLSNLNEVEGKESSASILEDQEMVLR
jgi:hypothetical protein